MIRDFTQSGLRRRDAALRTAPAWIISCAIHALLGVCLVFGVDRAGIPDGSRTGGDQQPIQLSARFTTLDTHLSAAARVEFIAAAVESDIPSEPPEQPASEAPTADPAVADSEPTTDQLESDALAAVPSTLPPEAVEEEGPAVPLPQRRPEISEPPPRVSRSAAAHYAALLSDRQSAADTDPDTGTDASNFANTDGTPGPSTNADAATSDDPGSNQQRFGNADGTSFFQITAQGDHFCYVVDCSSSMEDENAIGVAGAELNASLNRLEPAKRFQLLFYNSELHPLLSNGRDTFPATNTNRRLARQFITSQQPSNRALHRPALMSALRSKPDVIFLLTDGQLPELSARDLNDLKTANRHRAQINVIEFGKGAKLSKNWLDQLAQDHQGLYRYVNISNDG